MSVSGLSDVNRLLVPPTAMGFSPILILSLIILGCLPNGKNKSTVTWFLLGAVGMCTAVEVDLGDYLFISPNTVTLNVESGLGYEADVSSAFTTTNFAVIYGTVFEDTNNNGGQDVGEIGISDVAVTLDGSETITTGLYGRYTFSTVAGTHIVVETDPEGYFSTTPNTVTMSVAVGHGYQADFGDKRRCTCPPDMYEDDDTVDQVAGLTALTLGVKQTRDFCDDFTDWVEFAVKAKDIYTITTSSWGQRVDTFLALFDADGRTLLVANDNYEGATDLSSRIIWQAPVDGIYYVRVTNQAGLTGCYTDYDLSVSVRESSHLYLPLVARKAEMEE